MPKKGGGKRFTAKQDRQAGHIAKGYKKKGMSEDRAESIGFATINKQKSSKKKKSKKSS